MNNNMRFHYDKKEDAFYLRFNQSPYFKSEQVQKGIVFDYDKNQRIIGIEILDASKRFPRGFKTEFSKSMPSLKSSVIR